MNNFKDSEKVFIDANQGLIEKILSCIDWVFLGMIQKLLKRYTKTLKLLTIVYSKVIL